MSLAEFACGYEQAGLNFTLVLHVSLAIVWDCWEGLNSL
jgi:hypothetical protein